MVHFQRCDDGGLCAWCDEIPGFALSHTDINAVLADVQPALEGILTYQLGAVRHDAIVPYPRCP